LKIEPEKLKNRIIAEIRRLTARDGGQVPGQRTFEVETGIGRGAWHGVFWPNWSQAILDAGFTPNQPPEKKDSIETLDFLAKAVRKYSRFPSGPELNIYARSTPGAPLLRTIRNRFPRKDDMIRALSELAQSNSSYSDISQFLPSPTEAADVTSSEGTEGWVYLLRSGQHFKIGRSETLERRIKQISIALPETVTLVHAIQTDDTTGIEAYWHQRFMNRRANGEWFALTPRDVAAFKKRKFM
jgi:hypothetical protein